jgi:hypothetical protein
MSKKRDSFAKAPGISRRDFARRAAVAAAAMAALPSELLPALAGSAALPAFPPLDEPKLSPESQAEVDEKIQAILRKYGGRLSDDQKKDIHRLVTEGQKPLETLRAYKLDNSDQPATVLKLYPDPASAPRAAKRAGAAHPARKE